MNTYDFYTILNKPSWAPPAWLFGPVWSFLYVLIAISFGAVFYKAIKKQIPAKASLPFVLNLIFNFSFTPIQFGLQNNILAAIDIVLVLGTLIWAMLTARKSMKWVTYINTPYLLWVTFATILQFSIVFLNA